jgi:hypothetical protein
MPDNVSFREIPADVLVPGRYIEIDGSRADTGTPPIPAKLSSSARSWRRYSQNHHSDRSARGDC